MNTTETLKTLGLDEKEAAVYVAGLELGPASVQALAIKTKIKRTTVYQVLESLKTQKLFTETVKGKKRRFVAAHPNELKALENDRQKALDDVFPELLQRASASPGKPHVLYFDTLEGVHQMYEEALKEIGEETIGIADGETIQELDQAWLKEYIQKRKQSGKSARTILTNDEVSKEWQKQDVDSGRETRLLETGHSLPVNIEVVGNTVLVTSLKNEVLGLAIQSNKVAEAVRTILDVVWHSVESR